MNVGDFIRYKTKKINFVGEIVCKAYDGMIYVKPVPHRLNKFGDKYLDTFVVPRSFPKKPEEFVDTGNNFGLQSKCRLVVIDTNRTKSVSLAVAEYNTSQQGDLEDDL